jgi:hypothetical protein
MSKHAAGPYLVFDSERTGGEPISRTHYEQLKAGKACVDVFIDMTTVPFVVTRRDGGGGMGESTETILRRTPARLLRTLMARPGEFQKNGDLTRELGLLNSYNYKATDKAVRTAKGAIGAGRDGPKASWFERLPDPDGSRTQEVRYAFTPPNDASWQLITTEAPSPVDEPFVIKQTIAYASSLTGHHMIARGRLAHRRMVSMGIEDAYLTVNGITYREEFGAEVNLVILPGLEESLLREQKVPAQDTISFCSLWRSTTEPTNHQGDVAIAGQLTLELADGSHISINCPMTPNAKLGNMAMRSLSLGKPV